MSLATPWYNATLVRAPYHIYIHNIRTWHSKLLKKGLFLQQLKGDTSQSVLITYMVTIPTLGTRGHDRESACTTAKTCISDTSPSLPWFKRSYPVQMQQPVWTVKRHAGSLGGSSRPCSPQLVETALPQHTHTPGRQMSKQTSSGIVPFSHCSECHGLGVDFDSKNHCSLKTAAHDGKNK